MRAELLEVFAPRSRICHTKQAVAEPVQEKYLYPKDPMLLGTALVMMMWPYQVAEYVRAVFGTHSMLALYPIFLYPRKFLELQHL